MTSEFKEHFNISVLSGNYRSIRPPLDWLEVPMFAVLTGVNGAGKTQLLEAIDGHFRRELLDNNPVTGVKLEVTPKLHPNDVVLIRNLSERIGTVSASLSGIQKQLLEAGTSVDSALWSEALYTPRGRQTSLLEVATIITWHFVNFRAERLYRIERQFSTGALSQPDINEDLGVSPWEILNHYLRSSGISYDVVAPDEQDPRLQYSLSFKDRLSGDIAGLSDLSAGEATIIKLYLWLFAEKQAFKLPQLILLDEPDSHLHPTLVNSFMKTLLEDLVERAGCRVIMTTHRAETIAFTPEGTLFEMHKQPERIRRSDNKPSTIGLLSNNLIALVANKRPVFVEDNDDVCFYTLTMEILTEDGHWSEEEARPHFISARIGKGKDAKPAGNTGVKEWVRRFRETVEFTRGLIDRDAANQPENGVLVLDRHEHENYLLDPLVIYVFLATRDDRSLVKQTGIEVLKGKEAGLGQLGNAELQLIADAVLQRLLAKVHPPPEKEECERIEVEFVNGKAIKVPKWLLDLGGKELIISARGEWPAITRDALEEAFSRLRLVPRSLQEIMRKCVSPDQ